MAHYRGVAATWCMFKLSNDLYSPEQMQQVALWHGRGFDAGQYIISLQNWIELCKICRDFISNGNISHFLPEIIYHLFLFLLFEKFK